MDTQQLGNAFDNLPYKIKDWLSSLKVFSAVGELSEKFNLDYEQERVIPVSVLRLCVKDLAPFQFMGEIRNQLRVDPATAREISSLIHEKILVPIKSDLAELDIDVNLIFQGKISEQLPPPPPPPLTTPKTIAEARPFILHEETSWVAPKTIQPSKATTAAVPQITDKTMTAPAAPVKPPTPPAPPPAKTAATEKQFLPPANIHDPIRSNTSNGIRSEQTKPKPAVKPPESKDQVIILKPATPKMPTKPAETPMRVVNYSGPRTPLTPSTSSGQAPIKKPEPKPEPTVDLRKMAKPNPNEIDLRQKTK